MEFSIRNCSMFLSRHKCLSKEGKNKTLFPVISGIVRKMSGTVTVDVADGSLRGQETTSKSGHKYYSFKGIPYATPPIGLLRFKAPQPPEPWTGIRDAFEDGSACAQKDRFIQIYNGDEDCLYLNVYTPKNPSTEGPLKPVMVWFHGGGFAAGSGSSTMYGPDYLVAEDVVVVTLNYRLGPFGFLSLGNDKVPGNAGLKDQVMALRWVQQNIQQFGGDPGNVTIFGESAGGSSVHYHVLSPMSRGLFHRAVCQSGTALNWWAFTKVSQDRAFRLGRALGCHTSDPDELLEFLQKASAQDIVEAIPNAVSEEEKRRMVLFFFVPTVDNVPGNNEVFLPAHPYDLFLTGNFQHVPHIIGVNSAEGLIALHGLKENTIKRFDSDFQGLIPIDTPITLDTEQSHCVEKKLRKFYFNNQSISEDTKAKYADLISGSWFVYKTYKTLKLMSELSTAPIYAYKFSFDGRLGMMKQITGLQHFEGVCHADDIGYLFRNALIDEDLDENSPEYKIRSRMVKLWTNFAKTGNPTPEMTSLIDVTWQPVEKNKTNYLDIDKELTMHDHLEPECMDLWNSVYSLTNETKSKL